MKANEGDIQQDQFVGGRDSRGTRTSNARSVINKHHDVEELEMLLEAYFVQIDGTLNKLSTVYIYIYIYPTHHQTSIIIFLNDKFAIVYS